MIYLYEWLMLTTTDLLILYFFGIQYKRGGAWNLFRPVTVVALIVDVMAYYTTWTLLLWDLPRRGEYTLTQRLHRLRDTDTGWRGAVSTYLCRVLDAIEPDGKH
jgi:hypothetical protein